MGAESECNIVIIHPRHVMRSESLFPSFAMRRTKKIVSFFGLHSPLKDYNVCCQWHEMKSEIVAEQKYCEAMSFSVTLDSVSRSAKL